MSNPGSDFGRALLACAIDGTDPDEQPLRHVADLPPRHGRPQPWPQWADPDVVRAFVDHGIAAPWSHQLAAANLARDGRHVVLSTGTASGKSLAYQLPILTTLKANPRARALYLSPYLAPAHLLLGRIHLRNGRVREAIDALKISLWSAETAEAHTVLADAYVRSKDAAAARAEAGRALMLDPSSSEAKRLLDMLKSSQP